MKLAHYTQGRDNNFNLVRIVAAFAVLVSHSFALAIGLVPGFSEPLDKSLGMTLGSIAVDIFFIASGFLVTGSLLTRKSIVEFGWARVLRIYPALLVMVILVVFGLGPFFTTAPWSAYFVDVRTYLFLVKDSTLIAGVAQKLPDVFAGNPYPNGVNGSLWSMPYEVRMYALLAILWTGARLAREKRFRVFEYALVAIAIAAGLWKLFGYSVDETMTLGYGRLARLLFAFFSGATFYVLKERITLSRPLFWLLLVALLASAVDKRAFYIVYSLAVPYLLFYFAYVPAGFIRYYNRAGDYSYGVYIYAFPVQQSIAALIPHVSVLSMFLLSATVTLTLAVLSWHLLERHALNLKGYYVGHTRRLLGTTQGSAANAE
jgi:peptidoglycan/LPS O-acetylase OafA/YrhL